MRDIRKLSPKADSARGGVGDGTRGIVEEGPLCIRYLCASSVVRYIIMEQASSLCGTKTFRCGITLWEMFQLVVIVVIMVGEMCCTTRTGACLFVDRRHGYNIRFWGRTIVVVRASDAHPMRRTSKTVTCLLLYGDIYTRNEL